MTARPLFAITIASASLFAACGGSSGTTSSPTTAPVTISAAPASVAFAAGSTTPVPITVTRSSGSFASLGLSVADPTEVGVTSASLNGSTASLSIIPISTGTSGSTMVTAADPSGASTFVNVTSAACSTSPTLVAAQQFSPASGAFGVPAGVGTIYFVVYFSNGTTPGGNLHLVVQPHGTLEGGPLVSATMPPGTTLPTPIPLPNATGVVMSATVPALATGQQFETILYNSTCQPAVIGGSFST